MNKLIMFLLLKMIFSSKLNFIKNVKLPLIKNIILPLIENENEKIPAVIEKEIPFIRDVNLPVCVNCLHFIEHKTNYPYDSVPDNKSFGRCKKFGYKDVITGEFNYDFAYRCRDNREKCGLTGKFFEPKVYPPFQERVDSSETPPFQGTHGSPETPPL